MNSLFGIISAVSLFVPVLLILGLKLFTNRSFLALAIYYLIVSLQTLMKLNIIVVSRSFYQSAGIVSNLVDAPLMLVFLLFFSLSAFMTRKIVITIIAFIVFELIILFIFGFTLSSVKIILGPDIVLISAVSFIFFLRNVRLAITNSKSLGKAVMSSSVLLSYSIFTLVYIFYYLVENTQYRLDAQLVYYLVTILSTLLMSAGILIENKRIKKLDELKNTRRELATLYGETKIATLSRESRFLITRRTQ